MLGWHLDSVLQVASWIGVYGLLVTVYASAAVALAAIPLFNKADPCSRIGFGGSDGARDCRVCKA